MPTSCGPSGRQAGRPRSVSRAAARLQDPAARETRSVPGPPGDVSGVVVGLVEDRRGRNEPDHVARPACSSGVARRPTVCRSSRSSMSAVIRAAGSMGPWPTMSASWAVSPVDACSSAEDEVGLLGLDQGEGEWHPPSPQSLRRSRRFTGHRCRPWAGGSGRRRGGSCVQIDANISGSMVSPATRDLRGALPSRSRSPGASLESNTCSPPVDTGSVSILRAWTGGAP